MTVVDELIPHLTALPNELIIDYQSIYQGHFKVNGHSVQTTNRLPTPF